MRTFRHQNAHSLAEAQNLIAAAPTTTRPIAGGTDLLGSLKDEIHARYPEQIVNLKGIPNLRYIHEGEDFLSLGALTTLDDLEKSPLLRERFPLLAQAAHAVASPHLRRMGTLAGNICQEPRCWYYRYPDNGFFCTRKGGRFCNALVGENRFHSVFGSATIGTRPCTAACPANVTIPEYMDKVRAGDIAGAAALLLERNPLPAVTGRVCPHFCEGDCNRALYDEAVSVRSCERFLGDFILDHAAELMAPPAAESGRRVAVVGSGPAGLSAAFYLRRAGHTVTVYEREERPGGMLRYGIPAYRLPKDRLDTVISALESMGIDIRCGDAPDLAGLKTTHDALVLATGAWGRPGLDIEHQETLQSGLDFLMEVARGARRAPGPRLVVIGGGNVAVDVAVTARRLGTPDVTLVCLESREEMPALPWEIAQAEEEGVKIIPSFGPDRLLLNDGRVTGLQAKRCVSVFDDACRFAPTFDESITVTVPADEIMLAIGQRPESIVLQDLDLTRGYIAADDQTGATSLPGVYAAGDSVTGPATVVAAMAGGRRLAEAINKQLSAASPLGLGVEPAATTQAEPGLNAFHVPGLAPSPAARPTEAPATERTIDAEDAPEGLSPNLVVAEATRCFNCGCVAVSPSDLAAALVALDATVVTTAREIPAGAFFAPGEATSTILESAELVREIRVPRCAEGTRSAYLKFRVREAIDFPVAAAAVRIVLDGGAVQDARVVLGAAAPYPVRAHAAEDYLRGKTLSHETAERAAGLALQGSIALAQNDYKLQILKAMVRRALLACA